MESELLEQIGRLLVSSGLNERAIDCHRLEGSFSRVLYAINNKYLLRLSDQRGNKSNFESEISNLNRVAHLSPVPVVLGSGKCTIGASPCNYLLLTLLPGKNLYGEWGSLNLPSRTRIIEELALFLGRLHTIRGETYTIGHYIPTIPNWKGSWQEGHDAYIRFLEGALAGLKLEEGTRKLVGKAFEYCQAHRSALLPGVGARFLHGDLHPKNILGEGGRLSGVIDWECASWGEPDFDLVHLARWALIGEDEVVEEPDGGDGMEALPDLLPAILKAYPGIEQFSRLGERLTIYQLEHELHQLVWSGAAAEKQVILARRLEGWLEKRLLEAL